MNVRPEETLHTKRHLAGEKNPTKNKKTTQKRTGVERVALVVAIGCGCGNRWEPSECEVGSVSQQLADEPSAQQVVKALQIFSFIPDSQRAASKRCGGGGFGGINMWDLSTIDIHMCQCLPFAICHLLEPSLQLEDFTRKPIAIRLNQAASLKPIFHQRTPKGWLN